jgi:predicted acetyltransferase
LDRDALTQPAEFARYVQHTLDDETRYVAGQEGRLPATHLWFVEGDEYLGRLTIRFLVDDEHEAIQTDGHIGYDVRPTARRRGYATEMLRQALPMARRHGLDSVRITCLASNVASQKVIKANGGVPEHGYGGYLGFRINIAPLGE